MRVALFLVCFSLFRSSSLSPIDLSIPYFDLSQEHNREILSIFSQNSSSTSEQDHCLYSAYGGKTVEQISQLISFKMIKRSFDVQGSFSRLRKNLQMKLETALPFNILYLGGSVCVGHGCHLCQTSGNTIQVNEASFHCSWTHRLTRYMESLIQQIQGSQSKNRTLVSSRYCCKSATSTNMGLDILITQSYHSPLCQLSNNKHSSSSTDWEPDLVLWDYSVNDLSSRVSSFTLLLLSLSSLCLPLSLSDCLSLSLSFSLSPHQPSPVVPKQKSKRCLRRLCSEGVEPRLCASADHLRYSEQTVRSEAF
jgi:hypothetical protein